MLLVALASFGAADDKQAAPVKLTLHAAAEPRPALKYQLLPPFIDLRPGNAAMVYNKLGGVEATGTGFIDLQEKLTNWREAPPEGEWKKEAREALKALATMCDLLDLAARRNHCDWELPIHERKFVSILLPEVQQARRFANVLALQARLQVLDGKFDEAVRTMQTGLALGRHVAAGPTLVNGLVGLAITNLFAERLLEMSQRPGAPNLYWALTTLPHPLIDPQSGIDGESVFVYLSYPGLRELGKSAQSSPAIQKAIDDLLLDLSAGGMLETGLGANFDRAAVIGKMALLFPAAKQRSLARGYPADLIEKMMPLEVVALDSRDQYDELRDKMFRWSGLPFWESQAGLDAVEIELKAARNQPGIPLAGMILPAMKKAVFAYARTERQLAALRNLEALRLYAAAHEGKLPGKLSDVTEVPLAIDPVSGKEFEYRVAEGVGYLTAPESRLPISTNKGLRYEIRMEK